MIRAGSLFITFALFLAATAAEACPRAAGPHARLPCGQDRLQLPGGHLGSERGRHEPPPPYGQRGSRHQSPLQPGWKVDRLLFAALGELRRVRHSRGRRQARRLNFHSGNEEVVGWTPDSKQVVFRALRGDAPFPGWLRSTKCPSRVVVRRACPRTGAGGALLADGKRFAFNRHPSSWTRKHYRGSYAADIWVANLAAKTATPVLAGAGYNRYWPMFAGKNGIYFVGDPLPDDKHVKPGSLAVRRSLNNIYKVSLKADAQPVQVTNHSSGNVFYPSLSSDGKVIVYEADFGLWKLDVASGKSTEVKIDITTEEKENQVETIAIENEADGFDISPSGKRAVISARNQIFTVATDKGDISTIANDIGPPATSRPLGRPMASTSPSSPTARAARRSIWWTRTERT